MIVQFQARLLLTDDLIRLLSVSGARSLTNLVSWYFLLRQVSGNLPSYLREVQLTRAFKPRATAFTTAYAGKVVTASFALLSHDPLQKKIK